jgi:polygalacturonase
MKILFLRSLPAMFLVHCLGCLSANAERPATSPNPAGIIDPRTYGAKGDGFHVDTVELQKAIDACGGTGGKVVLTAGTYLTGPLELRAHMTLCVESGAVLLGSPLIRDYPVRLPYWQKDSPLCRSLLYATNADGLRIEGGGVIDGNCRKMNVGESSRGGGKESELPSLLRIYRSTGVTLKGVTLRDPCMWTEIYSECDGLVIDGIIVDAPPYCHNLDGIDICDCHDVAVRNCDIRAEDDAVCLKSLSPRGLSKILVENNRILCYRANAIKFGSSTRGPISHVVIRNNRVDYAKYGGLVIASVDGSEVSDILVQDLEMYHVGQPLYIRLGRRGMTGSINGITIMGLHARCTNPDNFPSCSISGIPEARIGSVLIKDCSFEMPGGIKTLPGNPPEKETSYPQSNMFGTTPAYAFFIRHAGPITLDHVQVFSSASDSRPWISVDDADVRCIDCTDGGKPVSTPSANPSPGHGAN